MSQSCIACPPHCRVCQWRQYRQCRHRVSGPGLHCHCDTGAAVSIVMGTSGLGTGPLLHRLSIYGHWSYRIHPYPINLGGSGREKIVIKLPLECDFVSKYELHCCGGW